MSGFIEDMPDVSVITVQLDAMAEYVNLLDYWGYMESMYRCER